MISPLIVKLEKVVALYSAHPAIIHNNKSISFAEIKEQMDKASTWLSHKGITRGSKVLVFVPMSIELYILLLATWRMGAVAVFVDAWSTRNRLLKVQQTVGCDYFIGAAKAHILRLLVPGAFKNVKKSLFVPSAKKIKKLTAISAADIDDNDTALITFTTGSTGLPKGADRSHAFLMAQNEILEKHLNLLPQTYDLTTLPIIVLNNLAAGVTSVLPTMNFARQEKLKAVKLIRSIQKYGILSSAGSPFIYEKIADYCLQNALSNLPLKKIFIGGAAVFPELINKILSVLPEVSLEIVYGSTEAEPISTFIAADTVQTAQDVLQNGLFVGRPVTAVQLKIISADQAVPGVMSSADFQEICLKSNSAGEICVSGKHVLQKYYNNEAAQRENKIMVDGISWHRTGDAGYLDKAGNLYLLGRLKQKFIYKDRTFYVFPYENYFSSLTGVVLGTLIKIKDSLIIVLETDKSFDIDAAEHEIALRNMPFDYKIVIKKIPRDPRHNSKIDYDALKITLS